MQKNQLTTGSSLSAMLLRRRNMLVKVVFIVVAVYFVARSGRRNAAQEHVAEVAKRLAARTVTSLKNPSGIAFVQISL